MSHFDDDAIDAIFPSIFRLAAAAQTCMTVLQFCSLIFKTRVESRPSCADILEYLMKNNLPISLDTDILLNLVKDLQISVVERLERKVSEKDGEIKRLRELLHASGIS